MGKTYESDLLGVIHEMAEDLHRIGAISDTRMRKYDKNCLVREPKTAKEAAETTKMGYIRGVTAEN
jgi:DNA-binding transcriptional regulator YiaG